MARFCTLFSSSSGNCIYIGAGEGGILIDAGVSAKAMERALLEREIDPKSIRAIFVTHEHSDHVSGLRVFATRYAPRVYATAGTMQALERMNILNGKFETVVLGKSCVEEAGVQVCGFPIPHDCAQGLGYRIHTPDGRRIAVATDLGHMTDEIRSAVSGCDLAVVESNHDERMLQNGRYPYPLKRRILSDSGHLSNNDCARELAAFAQTGVTRFVLAHLSGENNLPELAWQTALNALEAAGLSRGEDFLLSVAPRKSEEKVMVF